MATKFSLPIVITENFDGDEFDAILFVATHLEDSLRKHSLLEHFSDLTLLKQANANFENEVTFTVINKKRVVYSPTGPVNRDYDDVRNIADATKAAFNKAVSLGSKRPLLINCAKDAFEHSCIVSLLSALDAVHIPLELREAANQPDVLLKVEKLGFWHQDAAEAERLLRIASAIEIGRIVTRDIGGSDPERMSAPNVTKYVKEVLEGTCIEIELVEGQELFEKEYPCFAAVNRAANSVPRHRGQVVKLTYTPDDSVIDETVFLVGKGITYDTGGADIKYGGHMAGMHRDKCGAAFVAGFFKTLSLLKPKGLKAHGYLCLARNSVGEESYVADELITSRAKRRIRIGNTDAEGRMVMVDLLCEAKEKALNAVNPHLYTIATLTGHVIRAYGETYTGVMSNGPARRHKHDVNLQQIGDKIGDPYEVSTIRREDHASVTGKSIYEEILQATNNPSTAEPRGHQFPAAFLIKASGLDKHGNDSKHHIPYSHVDIAGSSGPFPGVPTGSPLPSFAFSFIVPRV